MMCYLLRIALHGLCRHTINMGTHTLIAQSEVWERIPIKIVPEGKNVR